MSSTLCSLHKTIPPETVSTVSLSYIFKYLNYLQSTSWTPFPTTCFCVFTTSPSLFLVLEFHTIYHQCHQKVCIINKHLINNAFLHPCLPVSEQQGSTQDFWNGRIIPYVCYLIQQSSLSLSYQVLLQLLSSTSAKSKEKAANITEEYVLYRVCMLM